MSSPEHETAQRPRARARSNTGGRAGGEYVDGARREPWGTVGDFLDPDGNRCSLRDEGSFVPSQS